MDNRIDMGDIYQDGSYLQRNPTWHAEDAGWKAQLILQALKRNNLHPAKICEVGCGAGEILSELSKSMEAGTRFSGYEISNQAYELCRTKEKEDLSFYHKDLLEEDSQDCDLILVIDVLEHVEDYLGFLKKLKDRSRHKLFHIPLDVSVQSVLRKSRLLSDRASVGHIHYFTKETALASLSDTGYEIKDYFYTSASIQLPRRGLKSTVIKLPRRILFSLNRDLAARLLGGFSIMVLAE